MKIVIRADSGTIMGSGHVMRCLVLAHKFIKSGHDVTFICADLKGNICEHVVNEGINLLKLSHPQENNIFSWENDLSEISPILEEITPDVLIVDHYQLGYKWEKGIRPYVKNIVAIDDYLDRKHDSDLYLNQNFPASERQNLDAHLPLNCTQILGPEYAILREEFLKAPRKITPATEIRNVLISFGGTDSFNLGQQILEFFQKYEEYKTWKINCVIGWQNSNKDRVESLCQSNDNFIFHYQIDYMAKLISEADLCIGAGGSSSWERLYIGVPSIIVSLAENQDNICKWLYKNKLSYYMGKAEDFSEAGLNSALSRIQNEKLWKKYALTLGQKTVDGSGADRIINAINQIVK